MKTQIAIVVLLFAACCAVAEMVVPKFTIETHQVSVAREEGGEAVEEILFKVDTEIGAVWRFDSNACWRVGVRDLISQKAYSEWKGKHLLSRLDGVNIPKLDLRNETITGSVSFLEGQIRKLDPTIMPDSGDFLRVRYVGSNDTLSINFKAKDVSALEALKVFVNVANLEYRVEDDHIVIDPISDGEGRVIFQTYKVRPTLRDRITDANITNILSEWEWDPRPWFQLHYSPEFDTITAGATFSRHQRLLEILHRADMIRREPGRFRLISKKETGGRALLFMLDDQTGDTWRYRASTAKDGKRKESFDLLQIKWYSERE